MRGNAATLLIDAFPLLDTSCGVIENDQQRQMQLDAVAVRIHFVLNSFVLLAMYQVFVCLFVCLFVFCTEFSTIYFVVTTNIYYTKGHQPPSPSNTQFSPSACR